MSTKIAGSIHTDAPARKPRTRKTLADKVAALDKRITQAMDTFNRLSAQRDTLIAEAKAVANAMNEMP